MFQLSERGPDTHIASSLCARCPHAAAGCCVAPPRMAWADVARVVGHGGSAWLLEQVTNKNLVPFAQGFTLRRVRRRNLPTIDSPRVAKCTFHDGQTGCTIAATHRPATCNYYVCESVLARATEEGHAAEVVRARVVHDALVQKFVGWDAHLEAFVHTAYPRLGTPDGPALDQGFLEDLAREFAAITAAHIG
jgi:hypothetical protein